MGLQGEANYTRPSLCRYRRIFRRKNPSEKSCSIPKTRRSTSTNFKTPCKISGGFSKSGGLKSAGNVKRSRKPPEKTSQNSPESSAPKSDGKSAGILRVSCSARTAETELMACVAEQLVSRLVVGAVHPEQVVRAVTTNYHPSWMSALASSGWKSYESIIIPTR
ncbi:hypothetical protein PIB30_040862 [Stylosanthes scabra]|uniref:Uncharacterized protein n=1 Tax=Stylosanthes scabra TaxID=79078 RepID=A0ABU6RFF8_9FABA|nr:hypothetical protein [Stylosanthes scabra]